MEIRFYSQDVERNLASLDHASQVRVKRVLAILRTNGHLIGLPYSKALGRGLFELRTRGSIDVRMIYAFRFGGAVILHLFVKKSMQIHSQDLMLAFVRLRDVDQS